MLLFMGDALRKIQKRKKTLSRLRELDDLKQNVLVIHYSCESFYDRIDGSTPRITSIAVRNLSSGQTESFSIHKIAELKKLDPSAISSYYDGLEKEMLDEFGDYLRQNNRCVWVHWNMRDINYGFQAIEHRHKVLGGSPPAGVPEERKFDLARALISIYGVRYAGHPRLESIMKINHITDKDFLSGKDEATAFDDGQYVKLHQSTLRKVDVIANLFERAIDGSLKTMAKWQDASGLHPQALLEIITEHWIWTIIVIISTIIGIVGVFDK